MVQLAANSGNRPEAAPAGTGAARGRVRVGIGGWTYQPWRGLFYPVGLAQRSELEFAARQFGAIEINATFYGRQSPKSWAKWAQAAPLDFQFAVKASRYCVTRPKLADSGEGIRTFFDQGVAALGDSLGPILWMFAARRTFDFDDIEAFLDLLPSELDGIPLRHAIEPRHISFRDDRFFALCRAHDVAVVFGDDETFPAIEAETASFAYARLQCMSEALATGYSNHRLDEFAEQVNR